MNRAHRCFKGCDGCDEPPIPTQRAEEEADELVGANGSLWDKDVQEGIDLVAEALVAFAEAEVQESINNSLDKNTAFSKAMFQQGYNAALDEACRAIDPGDDMTEGKKVWAAYKDAVTIIIALKSEAK